MRTPADPAPERARRASWTVSHHPAEAARPDERPTDARLLDLYAGHTPLSVDLDGRSWRVPVILAVDPLDPGFGGLRLRPDPTPFRPPPSIADHVAGLRAEIAAGPGPIRSNDTLARLAGLRDGDGVIRGTIQPARYHDALATNFAMDRVPPGGDRSLRQRLARPDRRLPELGRSPLVDHLGVVVVVESADGQLVVQHRSRTVANRPDTLSASASGSVLWAEVAAARPDVTLDDLAAAALREARAELGVRPRNPLFLGLVRELRRGGKPELYFFARSDAPFAEIRRARSDASERSETLDLEPAPFHSRRAEGPERGVFLRDAAAAVRRVEKRANLTLFAGILLAVRRLAA